MATLALAGAAAAIWHFRPITVEADVADRLAGERWYAVAFRHTPIGHYRAESGRTAGGDFEFRSELQFKLADDGETRIEDRFVFRRRPPHELVRAEHAASRNGAQESRIVMADNTAEIAEAGASRRIDANTDLELGDYLAVQSWLTREGPSPGETRSARSIDFDALSVTTQRWRIVANDGERIEVAAESATTKAPRATRITLDRDLAPLRMASDHHISLQRVPDETAARLWEQSPPLFASTAHRVAMDRPINDPRALERLVVAVEGDADPGADWPDSEGPGLLSRVADPKRQASAAAIATALAATVTYPVAAPEVRRLAERAAGGLDGARHIANALTLFVHGHLRYRDTPGGRTVFDTIRDRNGDCTEFADLFTTLARASGLPARTVIGLAYQEESQAFALHAWNEVAIDGFWRSVDPTWGETRTGAARFALPTEGALAAIAKLPELRFRVVETAY